MNCLAHNRIKKYHVILFSFTYSTDTLSVLGGGDLRNEPGSEGH